MSDISENATRSNYRTIRGVLFAMKEACPVNCDIAITLDGDGNLQLKWRWTIRRKPYGFNMCVSPLDEHYLYQQIQSAKDAIHRECNRERE